jgi:Asp-tRNA(Asn)/Glu-tRNA(Gln) amidotransferase A subunit family amidase
VIETAVSLLERLRARELSAVELLDAHLERVDRLNPEYKIVVAAGPRIVRTVEPLLGDLELRLVVQLLADRG